MPRETTILTGSENLSYGVVEVREQGGGRSAVVCCVGADGPSGVKIFKGDYKVPNEDAVVVVDEEEWTLLAVCDGHHGYEASHDLVGEIGKIAIPKDPLALLFALKQIEDVPDPDFGARSTLLVAVVDRRRRRGFGASFGDSSLVIVGPKGPRRVNEKNQRYVSPWEEGSLDPMRAQELAFEVGEGELVVAFTDGVDECCYGRAEKSVGVGHLENLYGDLVMKEGRVGAGSYARGLVVMALGGVEGNPGGQDNLGVVVTG